MSRRNASAGLVAALAALALPAGEARSSPPSWVAFATRRALRRHIFCSTQAKAFLGFGKSEDESYAEDTAAVIVQLRVRQYLSGMT